jgi:probable F420-dependent oxidoreductase
LEIFTLLSFLAGQTSTLRLHSGILVLPYRSPFESAKMAATLDYLSGGRLTLGVGSGWMKDEFDILGVPWRERGRLTDEYLAVIRALFEGHAHFESDHYRFDDVYFEPKPVQSPLPMWIAGTSEAALRRVARYGQGWFPVTTPDGLKGYRDRLRYLLDEEQRELDSVEIVAPVFVDLEQRAQAAGHGVGISHPDRMLEAIAIWLDAGATAVHVFSSELYGNSLQQVFDEAQWFSEHVMPEARKLRATR